jgi:hypothetical protein
VILHLAALIAPHIFIGILELLKESDSEFHNMASSIAISAHWIALMHEIHKVNAR